MALLFGGADNMALYLCAFVCVSHRLGRGESGYDSRTNKRYFLLRWHYSQLSVNGYFYLYQSGCWFSPLFYFWVALVSSVMRRWFWIPGRLWCTTWRAGFWSTSWRHFREKNIESPSSYSHGILLLYRFEYLLVDLNKSTRRWIHSCAWTTAHNVLLRIISATKLYKLTKLSKLLRIGRIVKYLKRYFKYVL